MVLSFLSRVERDESALTHNRGMSGTAASRSRPNFADF